MEKINNYDWVPLQCVGPFKFGSFIKDYISLYDLIHVPEEYNKAVNWIVYEIKDKIKLYVEDNKITAISCPIYCNYRGSNLIGMSMAEIYNLLNTKPDSMETECLTDGPQEVYDYDNLGLQLWVKDSIVVIAICNGA